jgi:tRNA A37 threonylcarbamoyltransferase TsaD
VAIKKDMPDVQYCVPDTKYSIDNAAMIGVAASFRYASEKNRRILLSNWKNLETKANLKLR